MVVISSSLLWLLKPKVISGDRGRGDLLPGKPPLRITPVIPSFAHGCICTLQMSFDAEMNCNCFKTIKVFLATQLMGSLFNSKVLCEFWFISFVPALIQMLPLVYQEKGICLRNIGLMVRTKRSIPPSLTLSKPCWLALGKLLNFLGFSAVLSASLKHAQFPQWKTHSSTKSQDVSSSKPAACCPQLCP